MTQGQKEIISIRTISCAFTVLALAIFKPFGFEVWQWEHCAHLLAIFAMGGSELHGDGKPSGVSG